MISPRTPWLAAVVVSVSTMVSAQVPPSFDELSTRVRTGDTVYVLDTQDKEIAGRVVGVSASTLTVLVDGMRRDFDPSTAQRIWRRGDSVLNGLAIGAVAGLLAGGFLGGRNPGEEGSFFPAGGFIGALVGAGLGWAIDAIIPGKRLVYGASSKSTSRVIVSPVVFRTGGGVNAAVRF